MKTLFKLIGYFIGVIAAAFFDGFILMKFYEWCIIPIGECFNYSFPIIKYGIFFLFVVGISLLKIGSKHSLKGNVTEPEEIKNIVSIFVAKLLLFIMLWISSIIIF